MESRAKRPRTHIHFIITTAPSPHGRKGKATGLQAS